MVKGAARLKGPWGRPCEVAQLVLEPVPLGQEALGKGQELFSGGGELEAALAQALQEPGAQLLLQGLDLLAQGRLGPEGGLGRFGKAPQFHYLVKAQELLPFHNIFLYR